VGYSLRYLMPLGDGIDRLRDGDAATLVGGSRSSWSASASNITRSSRRTSAVRLLATACEQAGELILIIRARRIDANDAFCRPRLPHEELESLPPIAGGRRVREGGCRSHR
jgi:hypothetical protein